MGLGFAIQEGNSNGESGIFIKTITPGGVAHKSEALHVGDHILSVNSQSLEGVGYDKVCTTV